MKKKFESENLAFQKYVSANPQCFMLRNADGSVDVLTGSDIDKFLNENPANQIEAQQ
jgi:argonaute-like protein implicated in RNA metabolism and viral defense